MPSPNQCLQHKWLVDDKLYLGILETLETTWMRRCLARRRWYRLLNAVRVMTSIRHLSGGPSWESNTSSSAGDLEEEEELDDEEEEEEEEDLASSDEGVDGADGVRNGGGVVRNGSLPVYEMSTYNGTFDMLHLILNNGAFGNLFCVQHVVTGEVYTAKHAKNSSVRQSNQIHFVQRGGAEKEWRNFAYLASSSPFIFSQAFPPPPRTPPPHFHPRSCPTNIGTTREPHQRLRN